MSNRVGVLGPIEITAADRSTVDTGGKRQRRLLAALAVRAGDVVSLDSLVDIVFEGNPTESAERTLQSYVSRLRRAVDGDGHSNGTAIERTSPGYVLRLEPDDFDAACFIDMVDTARAHAAAGDHAAAVRSFDDALRMWRGRPFAEFADEPWALAEAERLTEIRATAIEDRAESQLALGGHAEVVADLERFSRDEPTRERPRAQLMTALYRSGRQADALRVYQSYSRYLGDEMGLEPSAALRDLESRIITSDPSLDTEPLGGEPLRGYQLYEELGRGAFSVVHRGTQPSVGRDVAVKVIRAELANEPDFVRRFETEAHMVANLEHPHIVPLYDFWREPDNAYLVMRWLRGGTLRDQLARGRLSLEESARLVRHVGGALEAAHRRGIVHRDIKPANVFCDDEGNYYLGDFGIAIGSTADDELLAPLTIAAAYASPELLERRAIGPAADIYSLGATAFEALTGEAPFAAASDAELIERQCHEPLPLVSSIRSSVPTSVDQVIQRATAKSAIGRHASAADFVDAFGAAVAEATGTRIRSVSPTPSAVPGPNPYKGLRAFQEADAADFFGRSALTAELVDVLGRDDHEGRLLTVVGPSGSGKSSVVRAGLIPALREGALAGSEDWFVVSVLPGGSPFAELEAALLRIAVNPPGSLMEQLTSGPGGISRAVKRVLPDDESELVVVIDQFEELFTLVVDDEREAFLQALVHAIDDPRARIRVVATLRADFYDRPLRDPVVADAIKLSTVAITPLGSDELAEAIAMPAQNAGGSFEDGLVARIAADVADQPGSLPLLQYSLAELYQQTGGHLTHAAYESLGGVTGALTGRAETIYGELDEREQEGARRLFTRLVTLGEEGEDTRRRIPLRELGADPAVATALDAYGTSRLLAFDRDAETREPTVEVAHEALISEWPRLCAWIDDDREGLRIHRHLTMTATSWHRRGEDEADLYRGSRLETASTWADAHPGELNEHEQRFLASSLRKRQEEATRVARHTRRLRRSLVAVGVVAIVALLTGALAIRQQRRAEDAQAQAAVERDRASEQEAAAAAAEAVAANQAMDQRLRLLSDGADQTADPALATLLALEAHRLAPTGPDALAAIASGMLKQPGWLGTIQGSTHLVAGGRLVTRSGEGLTLRSAENRDEVVDRLSPPGWDRHSGWAYSPDLERIAFTTGDGVGVMSVTSGDVGEPSRERGEQWELSPVAKAVWVDDDVILVNDKPIGVYAVDGLDVQEIGQIPIPEFDPTAVYPLDIERHPDQPIVAVSTGDASHLGGILRIWETSGLERGAPTERNRVELEGSIATLNWGADDALYFSSPPAGKAWRLPPPYTQEPVELSIGEVDGWVGLVTRLADGSIFVGGSEKSKVVDGSGKTLAGPWPSSGDTFPTELVELDGDRIAVSMFELGTARVQTDVWSLVGDSPVSTVLPRFSDLADGSRSVQYFEAEQIAAVMSVHKANVVNIHELQVEEIWDLSGPEPRQVELAAGSSYRSLRLSPTEDGLIAAGLGDDKVVLHDARSGEEVGSIPVEPMDVVSGVSVSWDRSELIVFGTERHVYDVPTGRLLGDRLPHTTWVVRDHEAGTAYFKSPGERIVKIYDIRTGTEIESISLGGSRILPSTSGQLLASSSESEITILDTETGQTITLPNPNGLAARFDKTERFVIGWDPRKDKGGVQFWDLETQRPLGPFVPGVVGDQHLLGGEVAQVRNGRVHVWHTDPTTWFDGACDLVGRNLTQSEWTQYFDDRPYEKTCPQYPPGA